MKLKIVVMNPPNKEHQEELLKDLIDVIQSRY